MAKPKRHHYVPQFALRHFAADTKRSQVWTFDKRSGKVRLQAIRDSAVEGRFYDDQRLSENGIDLESILAEFEGKAAPVIEGVVQSKSLKVMGLFERQCVVDYALLQLFRTRASRELAKQGAKLLHADFDEEAAKQATFVSLIRDFEKYRRTLNDHIVTLRVARSHERFFLGDSVSLVTRLKSDPHHALTAILPLSTIIVPLSSSCCIMLFSGIHEQNVTEAGRWYRSDIRVLKEAQPTTFDDVRSINKLSVITSHRFLFASLDEFTGAREVLASEPIACEGPVGGWEESGT